MPRRACRRPAVRPPAQLGPFFYRRGVVGCQGAGGGVFQEPPVLASVRPALVRVCVRGPHGPMDFQNKPSPVAYRLFSNRARLSCSTNLNITRLISQARDMKPAVGSHPLAAPAVVQCFAVHSGVHLLPIFLPVLLPQSCAAALIPTQARSGTSGRDATSRGEISSTLPCLPATGRAKETRRRGP